MIRYPKLLFFVLTIILAYILFSTQESLPFYDHIVKAGYLGIFIGGIFYSYGFTAAPATVLLLIMSQEVNLISGALIGGLGGLLADTLIFSLIRFSMNDELKALRKERPVHYFISKIPKPVNKYLIPILGGLIIASPLPDEIGVAMLAGSKKISTPIFLLISFGASTIGIFSILYLGKLG